MRGKRDAGRHVAAPRRLIPARAGKTAPPNASRNPPGAHPRACGENLTKRPLFHPEAGSSPRVRGKRDDGEAVQVDVRLIPARAGKTYLWRSTNEHGRAHPRACGENIPRPPQSIRSRGSSPRVRGKPREEAATIDMGGLIPARAGKTPLLHLRMLALWAHPRACGENEAGDEKGAVFEGSSPRVRGKQRNRPHQGRTGGLIPACAGKTHTRAQLGPPPPAHPRVCGENCTQPSPPWPLMGSSPRVRGKQEGAGGEPCRVGLIPACAGKTGSPASLTSGGRAHPRVCGENEGALRSVLARWGSSPRVRGKLTPITIVAIPTRLIPACAGKTVRDRSRAAADRAHPRVCGENALVVWENVEGAGSSPRVRGKPIRSFTASRTLRLIPACAGKTRASQYVGRLAWAHPRVCGENVEPMLPRAEAAGSSPRVRGKRNYPSEEFMPLGLIPACAGKTSRTPKP